MNRDITPLTGKQKRRTPRPRFLKATGFKFVQGVMAFVCLVVFAGCKYWSDLQNPGMGPTKRQNVPIDEHPYKSSMTDAERLALLTPKPDERFQRQLPRELPRTFAILPEDDCGACNTNPTTQYVLGPHTTMLAWDQPGGCTGWNISESPDLRTWYLVDMIWSRGRTNALYSRSTTNNPVYWRVAAY